MILTNSITGTYVNRLTRKENRAIERRLDSLHLLHIQLEQKYLAEKVLRRQIFLIDSLDIARLKQVNTDLQKITTKQEKLIIKYKAIPNSSVSIHKLDSAYEAEN